MSNVIDPNERLQEFLAAGTAELRNFIEGSVISGNARELERIEQYYLNWKFYNGYHYKDYNHTLISFNYVKAFIDKINSFLLGDSAFSFQVVSMYNDRVSEKLEKPLEEYLQYTWRNNNKSITAHELLQMGSICGDVWVMPYWVSNRKFVRIRVMDSRQCFPCYRDGDTEDLKSFQVRMPLENNENGYRLKVINYTAEKVEQWYQKTATMREPKPNIFDERNMGADIYEYEASENALGFIPIVHIKNRPQSDSCYGMSDAQDILKLNKVYNEMGQELKGIIDYYATPTTVVTGATLKNMRRGLGNVWSGLPPEANVFTLGLDADLSTMIEFMQMIKTGMHEISDVPEGVLGKLQSISGTSAAALKLTFQPLVQQADRKALTYGEGIAQINEMIIRIAKIYDPKNSRLKQFEWDNDGPSEIRIEPVFAYGFPTDRMNILQEAQFELQLNIASKKEIMNRLGKNNVPDLLKQIEKERITEAALQGEIVDLSTPEWQKQSQQTTDPNAEPGSPTEEEVEP